MCRIFFLLNSSNKREKICAFLKQSTHKMKFTPGIQNTFEHHQHPDGFGLAWFDKNKWIIYKQPVIFHKDAHLDQTLANITSNLIVGHIRNKTDSGVSVENTHPFLYKNQLFLHNGWIKDFTEHRSQILSHIHKKYHRHIQGETDSEHLFYLFLTIKDRMKTAELRSVVVAFFEQLREFRIDFLANIIFADEMYIIITRYSVFSPDTPAKNCIPLSLYYDTSDGIVISSEPVTKKYQVIPEQSILILHHPTCRVLSS